MTSTTNDMGYGMCAQWDDGKNCEWNGKSERMMVMVPCRWLKLNSKWQEMYSNVLLSRDIVWSWTRSLCDRKICFYTNGIYGFENCWRQHRRHNLWISFDFIGSNVDTLIWYVEIVCRLWLWGIYTWWVLPSTEWIGEILRINEIDWIAWRIKSKGNGPWNWTIVHVEHLSMAVVLWHFGIDKIQFLDRQDILPFS